MARMKFLCDADRCIECNACVTARKNEHEVPWGITLSSLTTASRASARSRWPACAAGCPVNCFYTPADAVVLHFKDLCIGCGYCFYACPFGAPQYPKLGNSFISSILSGGLGSAGGGRPSLTAPASSKKLCPKLQLGQAADPSEPI